MANWIKSKREQKHLSLTLSLSLSLTGEMSNAVRAMTLEDVPSAPPDRLSVTVDTLTSITIQWRPPLEDKKNGVIKGYKVTTRITFYCRWSAQRGP